MQSYNCLHIWTKRNDKRDWPGLRFYDGDKYKIDYYHRKFDERNNNIRGTWNLIKSLISSGAKADIIKNILHCAAVVCTQIAMKWLKFSIITLIT